MDTKTLIFDDDLQPENCVCFGLRRAARMASKTFDDALKPTGLRNTQFALLGTLSKLGVASIGELSEMLATDGTTLTRNLKILACKGLIEDVAAADARVHAVQLTELGRKKYDAALPLWRGAQEHLLEAVGSNRWSEIRAELDNIEKVCT